MQSVLRYAGMILAGGLLSFAHPFRYNDFTRSNSWWTWILTSIGLVFFINLATQDRSGWKRYFKGLIGGFVFFAITHYWLVNALSVFGGIPLWLSFFAAAFVAFFCANFLGFWAWVAGLDLFEEKSALARSVAWAALWTGLESVRQFLTVSFHWGEIGNHFDYVPWVRESASIWGVHGLTFFWVLAASLVLQSDRIARERRQQWGVAIVTAFFLLGLIFAQFNLKSLPAPTELKVGLLQPDIPQSEKWNPAQIAPITEKLLSMTEASIAEGAELVVWPETAYPRLISSTQRQLPFSVTKPLIMGAVVRDGAVNRNSALMIEKDQILQRFDKVHLVPFGEFVPFQKWLPFKKLVANVGDFLSGGKDQTPLDIPHSSLKAGPLICYEDTFNAAGARLAKAGTNFFVNMTNDAWYGLSSAQEQHTAMSAFQVYQTFIPVLRATNNGITAIITPTEKITVPNFSEQKLLVSVPVTLGARPTFFVWTYPLMEWIWIFIFAIAAAWKRSQTKRIFFR